MKVTSNCQSPSLLRQLTNTQKQRCRRVRSGCSHPCGHDNQTAGPSPWQPGSRTTARKHPIRSAGADSPSPAAARAPACPANHGACLSQTGSLEEQSSPCAGTTRCLTVLLPDALTLAQRLRTRGLGSHFLAGWGRFHFLTGLGRQRYVRGHFLFSPVLLNDPDGKREIEGGQLNGLSSPPPGHLPRTGGLMLAVVTPTSASDTRSTHAVGHGIQMPEGENRAGTG